MTPAQWQTIRVTPSADGTRDAVAAAMFTGGAEGLMEDGASFVTHVPGDHDLQHFRSEVSGADAAAEVVVTPLDPAVAEPELHGTVQAHDLGRFVIAPPWLAGDYDADRVIIVEPGMAFGTGEHATTRGVLRLLPQVLRAGDVVADLGAGSAVLAIAAAKGGASKVIAIELDEDAMSNAEENLERNGVTDRVHLLCGDASVLLPFFAPVRVVLANIISSVHVEMLPVVATCLGADGVVIISGILQSERDAMLRHVESTGWRMLADDSEGEWWSATIVRA
ncbi:MAG: 50S ribosomal protein L11 methyltransferase [Gemmatimonadaceae bacterium]|nr:50S ribosomal protein L11 methyltransferase [Gemmatimonadaceae bacterium]